MKSAAFITTKKINAYETAYVITMDLGAALEHVATAKRAGDAQIIAQAFNVLHKTKKTPRKLAEQFEKLTKATAELLAMLSDMDPCTWADEDAAKYHAAKSALNEAAKS